MIEVRDLTKTFDGFKALDNISITVPDGSVYGLVGPNGAGKSTLIRNMLGIYKPESGTISFDSNSIWENVALKGQIASIPDDWFYFAQSTIKDMMKFYKGIYPNFSTDRYEKLKEAFPIDENKTIRTLSKGMQKQVAFWLALSSMPKYMILDEPVDGLDPVMRRQVWSLMLGDVAERKTTVIVSSHNLRELEDVCDHVGIMNKGKILLERQLTELQENMVKLQVVFPEDIKEIPNDIPAIHKSSVGRVHTIIMRMGSDEATALLNKYNPLLVDAVPLSLEEIFIYELGGVNYEIKDLVI